MRKLKRIIEVRYKVMGIGITFFMFFLLINLFIIQVINNNTYKIKLDNYKDNIIYGDMAPRGKIYDIKGRVIVDNKGIKVLYYQKCGLSSLEEINIAKKISKIIDIDYSGLSKLNMKEYWLVNNKEEGNKRISAEEYNLYNIRKLSEDDIYNMKLDRINDSEIDYSESEKKIIYIYTLMNKGYYYEDKVIKKNLSDKEYADIETSELSGIKTKIDWERYYPYGIVMRNILGSVGLIPSENKEYYLDKGYSLNDRVGLNYLELYYDDYLRGSKDRYQLDRNGNKILIEKGIKGNDLVLTIDIELQNEIEKIIEKEIRYSIKNENMIYYNRSFVIISDLSGGIKAMAGVQVINDKKYDYSMGIVIESMAMGSVIKGASSIVGYNTASLKIGEKRQDKCIKIAGTPSKCSWKKLGLLDDIDALKYSSNSYQYMTAINVGKAKYVENKPLVIDDGAFDIYRDTFKEFGLGTSTGIDLPFESYGYKGDKKDSGLLLDLAIGQYDTYTPMELSQYIVTIANSGNRPSMHLLSGIYNNCELVYKYEDNILNKVNTEDKYMNRIKEGFRAVMSKGGTGYSYMDTKYKGAGKTGTSETFIDTNKDGSVDTETISNTFVGYAPYDNPVVAFTVISPDIGYYKGKNRVRSYVNRRISYEVSKKYFEIYK